MKNKYLFLVLIFFFSIVFFPKNVFAANSVIKFQYIDLNSSMSNSDKEEIYTKVLSYSEITSRYPTAKISILDSSNIEFYNNSDLNSILINSKYIVLKSSVNPQLSIFNNRIRINGWLSVWFLDSDLNLLTNELYPFLDSNFSIYSFLYIHFSKIDLVCYNPFIYSELEILNTNLDTIDLDFYQEDIFLMKLTKNDNYFDINNKYNSPIFYEINGVHEISIKLLGEDIPEEFNFVYLVFDYLILLLFVIVIVSPFVIVSRLLRWK